MLSQDLKKAAQLSKQLKGLGYQPKAVPKVAKPKDLSFLSKYGGPKPAKRVIKSVKTPFKFEYDAAKVKDGKTPVKGQDYFTENDKQDIVRAVLENIEKTETPTLEVTQEFVKDIIKVMRTLEEKDRIEVQDIRNAQSFIYNKTKYGVHEMMHGGSSSSGTSTNVITQYSLTGVQAGSDVTVALSQLTHFATLTGVVVAYRNQIPQTQGVTCNITATSVTFFGADANEVFSITYVYA